MKSKRSPIFALVLSNLKAGGIQRVIINLSMGLQRKGATVQIVAIKGKGELIKEIPEGVELKALNTTNSFQIVSRLLAYIKAHKPDALLSTNPNLNIMAILAKKASLTKTRIVLSEHNNSQLARSYRKKSGKSTAPPFIKSLAYRWADALVAVSKGVAGGMSSTTGISSDQIKVIYNPVVSERLKTLSLEPVNWPKSKNPASAKLLGVGRLSPQKDFVTLLQSFSILIKRTPAQLLILGEGELRSELESEIERLNLGEYVELFGYTKNPYPFMRTADVFVSSSRWEGLPTVHVEALASGCQVVSTDCPSGPSEILDGGKYGRLVPVKDPEALAAAIVQGINDPIPKKLLRQRAEFFNLERSSDEYWQTLSGAG